MLRPCLICGHPADAHTPIDCGSYVTHDGATVKDIRLGGCRCGCPGWEPDTLSKVSELLGLDVRQAIL